MLMLSFYLPAVLTRTLLQDVREDSIQGVLDGYFPSTFEGVLTYMSVFLQSANYGGDIIKPLLASEHWYVGFLLLAYGMFMAVCVANFITGMFVEYILKAAKQSDAIVGGIVCAKSGAVAVVATSIWNRDL